MEYVAIRENRQIEAIGLKSYITPDFVRGKIAAGHAVIPANINHLKLEPMMIGNRFPVKISSSVSLGENFTGNEAEKIRHNCCLSVDLFMDRSCEESSSRSRQYLVRNSPVPVGTPPLYHALAKAKGERDRSQSQQEETNILSI
jgi:phosphomethylpyrimidine synthase